MAAATSSEPLQHIRDLGEAIALGSQALLVLERLAAQLRTLAIMRGCVGLATLDPVKVGGIALFDRSRRSGPGYRLLRLGLGQAKHLFRIEFRTSIGTADRKIRRINPTGGAVEKCGDNPIQRGIFFLGTVLNVAPRSIGNRKPRDPSIIDGIEKHPVVPLQNRFTSRRPEIEGCMGAESV